MSAQSGLYKKFSILDRRPRPEPEAGRENAANLHRQEQELLRAKAARHQNFDAAMEDNLYCTEEERVMRQQRTFAEAQEQLRLKQYVRAEIDEFAAPIGWRPDTSLSSRPQSSLDGRPPLSPEGPACSGLSNIGAESEEYQSARRRLEAAQIRSENQRVAADAAQRKRLQARSAQFSVRSSAQQQSAERPLLARLSNQTCHWNSDSAGLLLGDAHMCA